MHNLIENIHAWLRRNKPNDTGRETEKREKHWYAGDSNKERRKPKCIYCDAEHWSDKCDKFETTEKRKQHFRETSCVSIVERKAIEKTSVLVEDVTTAKQNIIAAYVTKRKRQFPCLQAILHLQKKHCHR